MVKMIPEHRIILLNYRGQLGNNIRQHIRLRTQKEEQGNDIRQHDDEGNNSEEDELRQIQAEAAELKKKEEAKSKKFKKLHSSIYYEGSEVVPEALRRRQLKTLLKMNNYTEDEIEKYSPPSPITTALKKITPVENFIVEKKKSVGNNSRTSLDTGDTDKYIEIVATRNGKELSEDSSRIPRRRVKETRATTAPPPPSEPTNSPRFRNVTNSPIQVNNPSNSNRDNSISNNLNSSGSTPSLAVAAKVVESEAQKRQSRQERARDHREKLEQERLRKLAARGIDITKKAPVSRTNDEDDNNNDNNDNNYNAENIVKSPVQQSIASPPIKTSRSNALANLNKKASPPPSNNNGGGMYSAATSISENVIRERQQEIIELENDLNNPSINENIQVEIRKQIALHRTCIAREQKRSDPSRNPTEQPEPNQQNSYNSPKEEQPRHQQPPPQEWDQPLNNGGYQRQQKQQQVRQQPSSQEWDQPIRGNPQAQQQYQQQQGQEWDQPLNNGGHQMQQQQSQPKRLQQKQSNSYNPANSLGFKGGNGHQRRPQWNDGCDEQEDHSYTSKLLKKQIFQQQGQQGGEQEWDQPLNNQAQRQQQRQYPPQEWDRPLHNGGGQQRQQQQPPPRQQQLNQQRYQQPPQQQQQQPEGPQKKLTAAERHRLEFQAQEAREQDIKNQKVIFYYIIFSNILFIKTIFYYFK
jgi:hypothetical protein